MLTLFNGSTFTYQSTAAQDETDFDGVGDNGTFEAGVDYAPADTITLSDGTVITVDSVDGGGEVLTFTVTSDTVGDGSATPNPELTQTSTSGTGTGFTLTLGDDNTTAVVVPASSAVQITGGVYSFYVVGTFDSGTVTLTYCPFPGGTFVTVSGSITANDVQNISLGQGYVKANISGATAPDITAILTTIQ